MEAVVSDILQSRKQAPGGLRRTALISMGAHAAAVAGLLAIGSVMPREAAAPRVVMSISLGGTPGPKTEGTQMIGGRAIEAAPPSEMPSVQRTLPVSPPPQPKMTLPDPRQKPRTPPKPTVTSKDPRGTARGRGFETQQGTARVDTGARGQGFGLSTGGGGGGGSRLDISGDFCCPEYLNEMTNRIRRNWIADQGDTGVVIVKYTIQRNGQLTNIEVETSSRKPTLDLAAHRALVNTRQLPPLPAAFTEPHLTVHLEFRYER